MTGSIVFVHGTGVRLNNYTKSVATVAEQLRLAGIDRTLVECAWGDPFSGNFSGMSLPDPPDAETVEKTAQELARWTWLFDDPLAELDMLSIRSASGSASAAPGQMPKWMKRLNAIKAYVPSAELRPLLQRGGVDDLWTAAHATIVKSPIVATAFQRSEEANELADAGIAVARAVVAQLHADALDQGRPLLGAGLRAKLTERLCVDWECQVFGLGGILAGFGKRIGTHVMKRRRNAFNAGIAGFVGDILLYQSRGGDIRRYIAGKIAEATKPVTLVGHSLGGIACVDMLAMPGAPQVDRLVTMGSQAPYFYEVDALASVQQPDVLPPTFPKWLNLFDRNDFLSFVGERLFPGQVEDQEVDSGAAFPEAHSAYLGNGDVWDRVRRFIQA